MGEWAADNQRLIDGGHWVSGASLQPTVTVTVTATVTATATVVRMVPGAAPATTDGPFAESKEQLGGHYLMIAHDPDQAIGLAAAIPIPVASLEVRPVALRPDAP